MHKRHLLWSFFVHALYPVLLDTNIVPALRERIIRNDEQ